MGKFQSIFLITLLQSCLLVNIQCRPTKDLGYGDIEPSNDLDDPLPDMQPLPKYSAPAVITADENLNDIDDETLGGDLPLGSDLSEDPLTTDDEAVSPDDDMMDTAENIVFRPLFKYKKQSVEKRRVYRDRNGNISVNPNGSGHVGASASAPHPSASRPNPPPILVYDKASGQYYPMSNVNPYYTSGGSGYPSYYRSSATRRD